MKALKLCADDSRPHGPGYDTYDELAEIDNETVRDYFRRELNEQLTPLLWPAPRQRDLGTRGPPIPPSPGSTGRSATCWSRPCST